MYTDTIPLMQNTVKHKACIQCMQRDRTDGLCKGLKYNKLSMLGISHNNESLGVFKRCCCIPKLPNTSVWQYIIMQI
jgi:hypothetical protein